MLGKETIDTRSRNRTRGKNGSTSENDGILGRELMTVDELKVMKDNECILFVRGIYPFFCDKFVIEKHPNYRLLEGADKNNAYLVSNVITEKFVDDDEQNEEDIHSEAVEESAVHAPDESYSCKDVSDDTIEQSVTLDDIIGGQVHNRTVFKEIPKAPKGGGSEPAQLDSTDKTVTAEPLFDTNSRPTCRQS